MRQAAADGPAVPVISGHDQGGVVGEAGTRRAWRRTYPASFVLAAITVLIVWAAVADLLRQDRLQAVLSAGRAELAAPALIALVVAWLSRSMHCREHLLTSEVVV